MTCGLLDMKSLLGDVSLYNFKKLFSPSQNVLKYLHLEKYNLKPRLVPLRTSELSGISLVQSASCAAGVVSASIRPYFINEVFECMTWQT